MNGVLAAMVSVAVASATGCNGCRHKDKPAAPGAQASASQAPSQAAPNPSVVVAPPRPIAPTVASLASGAPASPPANADPIFEDITSSPQPAAGLTKAESFRELGLHWSVPGAWLTEDYVPTPGKPHERRRTSHAPTNNAFFDVLEANVANQSALMWKGNEFPPIGMKPDGGEERHDWVPFASVSLGKLSAVGSHYTDGSYTYAWVFFKHPKTKEVIQVILTWASGDEASRKLLASIAASLTAD